MAKRGTQTQVVNSPQLEFVVLLLLEWRKGNGASGWVVSIVYLQINVMCVV